MESLTITKLNNSKRTSSSRRLSISTKPLVSNFIEIKLKNWDSQLNEDQFKIFLKQLQNLDDFQKKYFNSQEIEEYNRTHGDGVKSCSSSFFRQLHVNIQKKFLQKFQNDGNHKMNNYIEINSNNILPLHKNSKKVHHTSSKTRDRRLSLNITNIPIPKDFEKEFLKVNNNIESSNNNKSMVKSQSWSNQDQEIWLSIENNVKDTFWQIWRVKLLLTTGSKNNNSEIIEKECQFSNKFTKIYACLQLGNKILEWKENSLCIPQDADTYFLDSNIFVCELKLFEEQAVKQDDIIKACNVIIDWNCNKTYDLQFCNSQDFCDMILTSLGIEPVFGGLIGKFMKELQSCKNAKSFEFILNRQEKNGLQQYKFLSHREIDSIYPLLNEFSKEEKQLMIVFNRIFWIWWYMIENTKDKSKITKDDLEIKLKSTCFCQPKCKFGWPWDEGTVNEKPFPIYHINKKNLTL